MCGGGKTNNVYGISQIYLLAYKYLKYLKFYLRYAWQRKKGGNS